jgi:hypothetical protein
MLGLLLDPSKSVIPGLWNLTLCPCIPDYLVRASKDQQQIATSRRCAGAREVIPQPTSPFM